MNEAPPPQICDTFEFSAGLSQAGRSLRNKLSTPASQWWKALCHSGWWERRQQHLDDPWICLQGSYKGTAGIPSDSSHPTRHWCHTSLFYSEHFFLEMFLHQIYPPNLHLLGGSFPSCGCLPAKHKVRLLSWLRADGLGCFHFASEVAWLPHVRICLHSKWAHSVNHSKNDAAVGLALP